MNVSFQFFCDLTTPMLFSSSYQVLLRSCDYGTDQKSERRARHNVVWWQETWQSGRILHGHKWKKSRGSEDSINRQQAKQQKGVWKRCASWDCSSWARIIPSLAPTWTVGVQKQPTLAYWLSKIDDTISLLYKHFIPLPHGAT